LNILFDFYELYGIINIQELVCNKALWCKTGGAYENNRPQKKLWQRNAKKSNLEITPQRQQKLYLLTHRNFWNKKNVLIMRFY
jgi:hypothetical protein